MEETGVKRKLAVIFAADVAGYSRLMGAGILVGSVWNFVVTSTFIWLRPDGRR